MTLDVTLPGLARDTLADLHRRFGLDSWVLTRVVADDSMVIFSHGPGAPDEGTITPWVNSLEAHLQDGGPKVVGNLAHSSYAGAVLPMEGAVGFIGIPVHTQDGDLFGSLYGIGRQPMTFAVDEVDLALSLAARMLQMVLSVEQTRTAAQPQDPAGRGDVRRDPLTGLLNERGWDEALTVEAERCRRYGNRATVARLLVAGLDGVLDVDSAVPSDVVIRQTGEALRAWRRGADVVARTGEHAFSILLVEAWELDATNAVTRLEQTLAARRISARIGMADNHSRSLVDAVAAAQQEAERA